MTFASDMLKMTVGYFSFIEFMYCIFKHTLVEKGYIYQGPLKIAYIQCGPSKVEDLKATLNP